MTVHRITEAAHVDLAAGLASLVQVDTNLGIVAQTVAASGQWALTPLHVTSNSVSAGTAWTPATPPLPWDGVIRGQELVPLGAGRAVYVRTWVDVFSVPAVGEWTELFVLTTDGSTITVDSDTNLNTALGMPGLAFGVTKTAALAVLLGLTDSRTFAGVTTFHRVDISPGSIALSAAVGIGGGIFIADDYTVGVGSSSVSAYDGTGAVITTLSHPVASPSYLPFTANTGAIVGSTMAGPPGYALITLDPLSVDASGGPITFGAPVLFDGPQGSVGSNFAQITGAPAGEGWYFWPDELDFSFLYPPGDEAWNTAPDGVRRPAMFPDIFAFVHDPLFGWDHADFNDFPHAYVDGTLGSYINKTAQVFWPQGVGDGTIVVAYEVPAASVVAVWSAVPVPGPVARLTVTPPVGTSPDTVTLDGHRSSSSLPTPLTYGWDFGDGATSPLAPPSSEAHTYTTAVPHVFSATLTVRDVFGQEDSVSEPVTVGPAVAPPQRAFPRDDGLGMSTRRSFPPPTSDQYGIRRAPGEWYR